MNSRNDNTFNIKLSKLKLICLDIDEPLIGEKILKTYQGQMPIYFSKTFGTPLVVKSKTPRHLHLYYKCPENLKISKTIWCSRLGFPIEYISDVSTMGGSFRELINEIPLDDISVLPKSLYPFNYAASSNFSSLLTHTRKEENFWPPQLIKEGKRHNTLFNFLNVENFTFEHCWTTNFLLCDPLLPDTEINTFSYSLSNLTGTKNASKRFDTFEFKFKKESSENSDSNESSEASENKPNPIDSYLTMLNKNGILKKPDLFYLRVYEFLNYDRLKLGIERMTPVETIKFVAFVEKTTKYVFPDLDWVGLSIENTVLKYFKNNNQLNILYLKPEGSWYFWNKRFWDTTNKEKITSYIKEKITSLRYAGLGTNLKPDLINQAQDLYSIDKWPEPKPYLNFKNGVLKINLENKKRELVDHDPNFYMRILINRDYKPGPMSPLLIRLLLDFSGGSTYNLNTLRGKFYKMFFPGKTQTAFYVFGGPGGTKSTLVAFISSIFWSSQTAIKVEDMRKPFQSGSIVGKNIVFVNDLPTTYLNDKEIAFIKQLTGKDQISIQYKYIQGNFTTVFEGIIYFTSNYGYTNNPIYNDPTLLDRFIFFHTPVVRNGFKLTDLQIIMESDEFFSGFVDWVFEIMVLLWTQKKEDIQRLKIIMIIIHKLTLLFLVPLKDGHYYTY